MRQSGLLAAAALYAHENQYARLTEDHAHAKRLAEAFASMKGIILDPVEVETNIIYFDVAPACCTAPELCAALGSEGVSVLDVGPRKIRAVTNLNVTAEMIEPAIAGMKKALAKCGQRS